MNINKAVIQLPDKCMSGSGHFHFPKGPWPVSIVSMLGLLIPVAPFAHAEPTTDTSASFNSQFLSGKSRGEDLSRFAQENPVLAGTYTADVVINGKWRGASEYTFKNVPGKTSAETCFTLDMLEQIGIDTAQLPNTASVTKDTCKSLPEWLPQASARFDSGTFKMEIEIPQAFMQRNARGFVNPKLWDHGITAAKASYNFNLYQSRNNTAQSSFTSSSAEVEGSGKSSTSKRMQETNSAYLALNTGFNMGDWQFRHDSNINWQEGNGTTWQRTSTYARYPVQRLRGIVTLGDSYTTGELFESIAFRGAQLATDDRMLPDSLNGYAPIIRGMAETNALVEVHQSGQLIYQTNVSQGPFIIDDLYPTGYGGDLEVTVHEANGEKRQFRVPYASVPQMLRPGIGRYSLTAGQVRNDQLNYHPNLLQATFQRGLTNIFTGYTGATVSEGYSSIMGGTAVSTPYGAFSFDVTRSSTRFDNSDNLSGQSYKIGFNRYIPSTNTSFTFAAYRYSTKGYLNLIDAMAAIDYDKQHRDVDTLSRQRNELQLTLNQGLGDTWGALYVTGSVRDYWNSDARTKQYQMGYNNSWGSLTYGLSALRTSDSNGSSNTRYYVSASLPIGGGNGSMSLNSNVSFDDSHYESSQLTLSGSMGQQHELNYSVTASDYRSSGQSGSISGQYNSPYANFNGSYSHSRDFRQLGLGASGTIVAHSHGLTLSPQRGDTMALIEAPGAKGATVSSNQGVRVNEDGYALVPYITPYRLNAVTLDPTNMSNDVELQTTTRQSAPYAGSIVKITYPTRTGTPLLIRVKMKNGEKLPFGSSVYDKESQNVGLVGQGSRVFVRSDKITDQLTVKWGESAKQQCSFTYSVPHDAPDIGGYRMLETECQ